MLFRYCLFVALAASMLHAQMGRGGRGGLGMPGAGTQVPPATDCAVSGTVVNAITGEPIIRAMVSLNGADGAGSATDTNGRWSISNTTCGMRFPNATHIGFIAANQALATGGQKGLDLVSDLR